MKKTGQMRKANSAHANTEDTLEYEAERWRRFGKWMADRRLDLRMTQLDAARKAGMSRVNWARIETGAGTKSITIPDIARALGYATPSEINQVYRIAGFARDQETVELSTSMQRLRELPVEIREAIEQQIDREYERIQLKKEKRARK